MGQPTPSARTLRSSPSPLPDTSSFGLSVVKLHILYSSNLPWQINPSRLLIIHVALLWIPFGPLAPFWWSMCLVWGSSLSSQEVGFCAYGQSPQKDKGGEDCAVGRGEACWGNGGWNDAWFTFWLPRLLPDDNRQITQPFQLLHLLNGVKTILALYGSL